ncbi:MAG: hypothetical protein IJU79_06670 [Desulfovibrionaceae bacterium]|nr:hypothetical protein [Desulfovibrionaceae bacterium]
MQNQGLKMLDHALEIAAKEKSAMEQEDYEDAINLSIQRGRITNEAWDYFEDGIRDEYRQKLIKLNAIHKTLYKLAVDAHTKIAASLSRSRQEKRRMRGYQVAVAQALR